jgi:ubiquinol-cytochrome c reductase cytochrome b subunit
LRIAGTALLVVGLMLFGVAAVEARTLQVSAPVAAPTPVITDGPTLFRERGCAHCHEIKGVGGDKGPDLSGVGRRMKKDAIERQIVQGGDAMPAFGQALPSEEIAALVGYLHKCKDKHTPAKKPVPAVAPPTPDSGQ